MAEHQSDTREQLLIHVSHLLDARTEPIMAALDNITRLLITQQEAPGVTMGGPIVGSDFPIPDMPSQTRTRATPQIQTAGLEPYEEQLGCGEESRQHVPATSVPGSHAVHSARSREQGDVESSTTGSRYCARSQWRITTDTDGVPQIIRRNTQPFIQERRLHRIVRSAQFDMAWLAVILLDCVFHGLQLEYAAVMGRDHWSELFGDVVFTALLLTELFLRIGGEGMQKYMCGSKWPWAALDLFIVGVSALDFYAVVSAEEGSRASALLSVARVARLFRVLRLAKVIQGLRYLRHLRLLCDGIVNSLAAISWTILALTFVTYLGAVVVMTVVIDNVQEGEEYYVEYWDGVATSMCTLFAVMTGDSWWTEVVAGIRKDYPAFQLFFIAYYCFTAYGLLNVVTGIFVDQTLKASQSDFALLRQQKEDSTRALRTFLGNLFHLMGPDASKVVEYGRFERCLSDPEVKFALGRVGIQCSDLLKLFFLLDRDGNGLVDIDEFMDGCMNLQGPPSAGDILELTLTMRNLIHDIRKKEDQGHAGESSLASLEV